MKMTHGEIRGTIALGLVLALTLGVLACVRGCSGSDAVDDAVPQYDMPGHMRATTLSAVDSTSATPGTVGADSASAGAKARRARVPKRQRKATPPPPDRPSPLDSPK